ncbi:hypothetical protein MKX01_036190 [Papaver californicum]|nr:hypothetical protein MKX01_036190 [Papaver californicum]
MADIKFKTEEDPNLIENGSSIDPYENGNRKRMRDGEYDTVESHHPNLTHINPIFQPSEPSSNMSSEMKHTDQSNSSVNRFVEGDSEMNETTMDTHTYYVL